MVPSVVEEGRLLLLFVFCAVVHTQSMHAAVGRCTLCRGGTREDGVRP